MVRLRFGETGIMLAWFVLYRDRAYQGQSSICCHSFQVGYSGRDVDLHKLRCVSPEKKRDGNLFEQLRIICK